MTIGIDMGTDGSGAPAMLDLEELLATRLLVQGNSGSGKSHLLRRLIEGSAEWVQQVIIDPEGDFVTLADRFGHVSIQAADHSEAEVARLAARIRAHRVSVVLSLEGLDIDGQMKCAAAFLGALFDAPRDHWFPVLVVVDEAQLFAPAVAGEVSEDARKGSLGAMTNLMCRGRKRGLAGVIATQRLAKLAKNVAAEASNFLMGRTFLDIDMARAADLLGMERRQAEQIRDLERGHFLALGPALCRRPRAIRIGAVETSGTGGTPKLAPLPRVDGEAAQALLFDGASEPAPPPPPPRPAPPSADELMRRIARPDLTPMAAAPASAPEPVDAEPIVQAVLADMVADAESSHRTAAVLFQDFGVRCRMKGLSPAPLDLPGFTRRLAMARAGLFAADGGEDDWATALAIGSELPDDMLGVFLLIARAARDQAPCPSDADVARVYGTHSIGRARRLLGYMEAQGIFVPRTDLKGRRSIGLPRLGWATGPEAPDAAPEPTRDPAPTLFG
ncbi:ATP-binding protein [Sphingomonas sp. 1P06PA]|uniref:helicase HerA domain-containing protein n=1 Tax=Sphingomonas sp. 1P06PA TaxID=554121 RepID=UPI0039A43768